MHKELQQKISITNTTGGNWRHLDKSATTTVVVKDDGDKSTITLTGSEVTEGEKITITATVDNAPETDLTITFK